MMLLQEIDIRPLEHEGILTGTIARFTEIDTTLPWFDFVTLATATEEDVQTITIPPNLRPNYSPFFVAFSPADHILVFEQYGHEGTLSPRAVYRFFEQLLNSAELREEFGPVLVSIISDHEQLEEIVRIPRLTSLRIMVQRPNPDDLGRYDAEIEARLREQHATSLEQVYATEGNQSISPDATTMALADVATRNGEVQARGYDEEGRRITRSTTDHPALASRRYDPDLTTARQAFRAVIGDLLGRLRGAVR